MSYSEKFMEIMNSSIRPKCEPKITVTGTAEDGTTKTVVWGAKDIKSLNYKRNIDVVGRNLPTMELQWEEVYYGKFNAQNFPIKYTNVVKYMAVTLEFKQYLGFYETWKTLKALTWKQVKNMTWKQVKDTVAYETITMPTMFLAATPEVSGHIIKWKAVDALSFLTEKQTKGFIANLSGGDISIPLYNPIVYLLVNARAGFTKSKELFNYLTRTINYFNELPKTELLKYSIIFDDATNSCIMNYLSATSQYLDFDTDKIVKKSFGDIFTQTPVFNLPLKLQYGTPTYELGTNIAQYAWKRYIATIHDEKSYVKSPDVTIPLGQTEDGKTVYQLTYNYDNYGTTKNSEEALISEELTQGTTFTDNAQYTVQVSPISYDATDGLLQNNTIGDVYSEDNKQNVFQIEMVNNFRSGYPIIKYNNLIKYFKAENGLVKTQTPALFPWKIGTLANCETLLYNGDERMVAKCILCETNIQYNGAIRQSNVARQVG